MWDLNYDSISQLDSVLRNHGLAMSKKFGQNFLISASAREKIVQLMALEPNMDVWEVGPGLGAITHLVLKEGVNLKCFEIDHGFASILREEAFFDEERFSLIEGDALKTLFLEKKVPDRIIGNLPYNVGSIIIAKLIENNLCPEKMVFTLQKEVVDRMCATVGDSEYSSFSILTQIDYENKSSLTLKKGCFWPQPQVDSAVVLMERRDESLVPDNLRGVFFPLIRALFSQRRKTVKNNLMSSEYGNLGKDRVEGILRAASLMGTERAEAIDLEKLIHLAEVLSLNK